ncbi:MAG: lysylphosphatidylglycerol synthase transmembrane domain-containing protein [Deltaproteobacteria bacterium]|nr:lysylphosphatidylglycerol synthase transmembrane domain-containing protein [Deltaproteobacteria bacterium]
MPRRFIWLGAIATLISGGILALMLSQLDARTWQDAFLRGDVSLIVRAGFFAFALLVFRALRFTILGRRVPILTALTGTAMHTFIVRVMPLRLGEISLPVLFRASSQEPPEHTLVSIALVRLVDLTVILATGIISIPLAFGTLSVDRIGWGALALCVLVAVVITFHRWILVLVQLLAFLVQKILPKQRPLLERLTDKIYKAVAFNAALDRRSKLLFWIATAGVSACQVLSLSTLIRAYDVELPLPQMVVGVSSAMIFGGVPLLTVGSFGTHETGWTLGFMWVGVSSQDAIVTGIASGLLTLGFALCFAIPAAIHFFVTKQPLPKTPA